MKGCVTDTRSAEAGATLIEVLVVLVLAALIAGIAWPMHGGLVHDRVLPSVAGDVASLLKHGRADAIRSGREILVSLHIEQREVTAPGRPTMLIPKDVAISLTAGRGESRIGSVSSIRFHPDGRSSGAEVLIEHRGRAARIIVDRSSGGIRVIGQ